MKPVCNIVYCQTPVLGLGLGVDYTFAWDNKNNDNDNNNPHLKRDVKRNFWRDRIC